MSRENIAIRILETAAARPDHLAMVFDDHETTYGQLSLTARQWAQALAEAGVEPGQMVGIALRDFVDNFAARVAVWLLGATAVPLDVMTSAAQRRELARSFDVPLLIEDQPSFDDGRSIRLDDAWRAAAAGLDGEIATPESSEAPAVVTLTSGTTGAPAGIATGHEAVIRAMAIFTATGVAHPEARFLNTAWHTAAANVFASYAMLLTGGAIIFQPAITGARQIADRAAETGATAMLATPNIVQDLVRFARESGRVPLLPSVTHLAVAGAPSTREQLIEARDMLTPGVMQLYGSASAGGISHLDGPDLERKGHTIGRAIAGVAVQTVDEDDVPTPTGIPGRVRVSPPMASKILGPVRTTGDMIRDGWCYPGDIGVIDDEGYISLLGREGDVINCGGVKIHPAEVEAVLASAAGLREVAVAGVPADRHGEIPVAFVVTEPGISAADLEAHCRQHLEPAKRPHRFEFRDTLPRNPGGKVVKRDLVGSVKL